MFGNKIEKEKACQELLLHSLTTLLYITNFVFEGAAKSYLTHYSSVDIILFKRVYVGLYFLPILLEN